MFRSPPLPVHDNRRQHNAKAQPAFQGQQIFRIRPVHQSDTTHFFQRDRTEYIQHFHYILQYFFCYHTCFVSATNVTAGVKQRK